ncbi:hypothetical protein NLI96_g4180 [Meripilus lineatus]|uniref:NACHT domain-containing protein n=1 Tax=Meripilus lineatus TaxID=2056292 RepID=A0AAD5YF11_9APHY|nr:hypothetical protein NLI96_g4180 [Physisporinus lineatus]
MTELRNGDNQLSVIEGTHVHAYHQMRVSVTGPCVKDSRWENGTKSRKEALTMDRKTPVGNLRVMNGLNQVLVESPSCHIRLHRVSEGFCIALLGHSQPHGERCLMKFKLPKTDRQKAMGALITDLKLLDILCHGIPAIGNPIKAAVSAAIQLLEGTEAAKGNADVLNRLDQDIVILTEGLFKPLKSLDPSRYPGGLLEAITELITRLESICQEIHHKSKSNFYTRHVNTSRDEGDIIDFREKIINAIQTFDILGIVRAQIQAAAQYQANRDFAKYRKLVDKLPRAKTAGWNAGRSNAPVSCFEGTREDVLQTITEWIDSDVSTTPRVFWLNGLAGIGKSTVARTIAERAYSRGILGGSFFFSRNDSELNNVETLFSTLAHQLAQYHTAYLKAIAAALEQDSDLGFKDSSTQLKKLFFNPILASDLEPTVLLLVLDGLDEASPNDSVKKTLQLLLSVDVPFALRVFLTSRPEAHIRLLFDNDKHYANCVLHNIEDLIVEGDIRRFLEHRLPTIPKELGISLPDWPSTSDLDAVVAKSGRLFIFAATVVRFVADDVVPDPQGRLIRFLHSQAVLGSSTYKQLDQLYLHVLQSTVGRPDDPGHIRCLRATLAAIVLLRNPIPLAALAALIGYDPEHVLISLYRLHSIILVPSTIQDTPKIFHLSFSDFITDSSRCTDQKFYVDVQSQEVSLLLQCLGTMKKSLHFNMGGFDMGPYRPNEFDEDHNPIIKSISNEDISHDSLISPELGYACQFWCSHLLKIENPTSEMLDQLKVFSFEYLLFWIEAMSLLGLIESARAVMREAHQWAVVKRI